LGEKWRAFLPRAPGGDEAADVGEEAADGVVRKKKLKI
jgi:hypothetical protein